MNALEMIDEFNTWLSYQYADRELDDNFYSAFDKAMQLIQDNPNYWANMEKRILWNRAQSLI